MTWRVHITSGIPFGYVEDQLMIFNDDARGGLSYIAGPLTLKTVKDGESFSVGDVTMRFPGFGAHGQVDEFLRAFVDAAWERGIKPTKLEDFANELAATRRHLEDMRALTFKSGKPGQEGRK